VASDLKKAFDAINDAVTDAAKETLTEVGQFAVAIISLRTRKGLDADRHDFKPYSKNYVPYRKRRGLRVDKVDLTVTGHMLGSITPTVTGDNEVTLEFNGTKEIAKAIGNTNLGRDFFDVRADEELDALADILGDKLIAEILK